MTRYINKLYDRRNKYQFRDAAREVLGRDELRKLEQECSTKAVVFGEFLHKQHPGIFVRLVAWMKIKGVW
jgi:hypothetical protein